MSPAARDPNCGASVALAAAAEAGTLTAVAHAAKRHWDYSPAWIAEWESALTVDSSYITNNWVLTAKEGDRTVGFTALECDGEIYELSHLWVLPEYMGRGIGRLLFQHAVDYVCTRGGGAIEIDADPNAADFYRRLGAQPIGQTSAPVAGTERYLPRFRYNV